MDVTLVAAVVGLCAGTGLLLIVSGLTSAPTAPRRVRRGLTTQASLLRRATAAAALAVPTGVFTRWPVAALGVGALGWFSPELFGGKAARDRATARTEAIAGWTEMLRDTMSGAHGLEEAVLTTAAVAPAPIQPEVTALSVRLEQEPLTTALRAFASDLAHPAGDLVVASLMLAASGPVGDLGELLGTLAVAAREEAGMRLRVEAARARLRTAVRVITGCTLTTALGLMFLNRSYLDSYGTAVGQLVLALVAAGWALALWWLGRMSDFTAPERFLTGATDREEAWVR